MLIDLVGVVRAACLLDIHDVTLHRIVAGERVLTGTLRLAMDRVAILDAGGIAALERAAGLEVES